METFAGKGSIGNLPMMMVKELKDLSIDPANATDPQNKRAEKAARDRYLAATMLSGANYKRFNQLRVDLANQFALGQDNYPGTPIDTLDTLNAYQGPMS
jgi:hypothetical protein